MGVLGADGFEPAAVVAHEVAKASGGRIERVGEKRDTRGGELVEGGGCFAVLFPEQGEEEGAGVVVGAVAVGEVGHGEQGVLQHAGGVTHAQDVIEFELGQARGVLGERAQE